MKTICYGVEIFYLNFKGIKVINRLWTPYEHKILFREKEGSNLLIWQIIINEKWNVKIKDLTPPYGHEVQILTG